MQNRFASRPTQPDAEGGEARRQGRNPGRFRWPALWLGVLALPLAAFDAASGELMGMQIMSRQEWSARDPILAMQRQTPSKILIHHTATRTAPKNKLANKMKGLQRFSQSREKLGDGRMKPAWADIPYHFYIDGAGRIAEGREIGFVGDSNTSYQPSGYIQIVLEGNFETEKPAAAQLAALKALSSRLMKTYGIPSSRVGYHQDVARTACPGKNLILAFPKLIAELERL